MAGNNAPLKDKVVSGLVWIFGERILAQGVSFLVSIILARILMPEEYGIVALVLVFLNITDVFVSNGFGESLVQKQHATETDFSTVFYCSFAFSWLVYAVLFASAGWVADYYANKLLCPVLRVLALKIPLASVSSIQHAYVSKHMIFKKFFFSSLGGTLLSGGVGIAMALGGCGVWALVGQYLVNTMVDTVVLFLTVPWRPRRLFSAAAARQLIGYGWKLTAASLINTIYGELRSLIIGKKYSSADLAYYNRGNQFPSLVIANVDTSIGTVVFPAMAAVGSDAERLRAVGRRAMKTTSYIIFPLLTGLFVVAEPLVELLLTEKWLVCVPYLRFSCLYFLCQPIQTMNWQVIKTMGRSDLCLKLEMLKKGIGIAIILVTMNYGVTAIAAGNAAFAAVSMFINMLPNRRLIGYTIRQQFADLLPAALLSLAMGGVVYALGALPWPPLALLPLQIAAGGAVYLLGSVAFRLESFTYLFDILKRRLPAR